MRIAPTAYLGSYLLSMLGNSIAAVALPLIVLQTTGSTLGTGVVAAATAIPAVLAGVLMGGVIDRINRRTSSVVTDVISGASVAALPLIDLVTDLSIGWFVLFGVIGSLGDVPGLTARDALLPAVVRHSGVTAERLIGLREGIGAVAMLAGPAAAGTLIALLPGSAVLWITAATSGAAALLTLSIPHRVGRVDAAPGADRSIRAGLGLLLRSPFLRTTTVITLLSVLVLGGLQGLVLPLYFTEIDRAGQLGFVLAAIAAGMLVGAGAYAAIGARLRRRAWLLIGVVGTTIGLGLIVGLPGLWVVLAGAVVLGAASGALNGVLGVLMIERIPEDFRGRVMGAQNAAMTVAAPAGIMTAALVGEAAGVLPAALALGGVWLVAAVVAVASRSMRTLDRDPEE